jgi:hypothetical protein
MFVEKHLVRLSLGLRTLAQLWALCQPPTTLRKLKHRKLLAIFPSYKNNRLSPASTLFCLDDEKGKCFAKMNVHLVKTLCPRLRTAATAEITQDTRALRKYTVRQWCFIINVGFPSVQSILYSFLLIQPNLY